MQPANIFDAPHPADVEPVHPGVKMISDFLKAQPEYLTENFKTLLASATKGFMKCVRAKDGVINILSDQVLVRIEMPGIPDGAYLLSKEVTKAPPRSHWSGYPDVDIVEPDFQEMAKLFPVLMDKTICGSFMTFCQAVRSVKGQVLITKNYAALYQDQTKVFQFPFGLNDDCVVHPDALVIAFKEAQRYELVYISRQVSKERSMPLVIGNNWKNCILVSTQPAHAYYNEKVDSW